MGKRKKGWRKRASQLWYRPQDYDLVKRAAEIDSRPMTQFAIMATLKAAAEILSRSGLPKYAGEAKEALYAAARHLR